MARDMDGRRTHVLRSPLPWNCGPGRTECGKQGSDYPPELLMSHDEVRAFIQKHGIQRAAFVLCMTCVERQRTWLRGGERWPSWDEKPMERLAREFGVWAVREDPIAEREFLALGELVAKHRDEFEMLVWARGGPTPTVMEAVFEVRDILRNAGDEAAD